METEPNATDDFDGIQNGIRFSLNIDNIDTVFKFKIVNQTGHIMSNKHAKMITEESAYYHVSDDYLKTRRCPYPGLVTDIQFGIEDEINCNVTITVTVEPAVSELDISREITVKIDGQTQEPAISVYQLQLNATKECASYQCIIECKNRKNQDFLIQPAGASESDKALLYVITFPHSIQYSPFKYELLFTCYDINFYFDTQVTATANFTFYDISVTSSTVATTVSTFGIGTTLPKKALTKTETDKLSSRRNLFSSRTTSNLQTLVSSTTITSSLQVTTTSDHRKIWSPAYTTTPANTASVILSIGSANSNTPTISYFITSRKNDYISTQLSMENSMKTFSQSFYYTSNSEMQMFLETTALSTLSFTQTNYSSTVLTENASTSSDSFFDKPTNVIALSTVAGVAAASAVGTGAYALTSKRCKTAGIGNKERSSVVNDDNEDQSKHYS